MGFLEHSSSPWRKTARESRRRHPFGRGGASRKLRIESLESRRLLAVTLSWYGAGTPLNLTEGVSGATPAITISEPSPNESVLEINLGAGHAFASGSTLSQNGLTYQNAGSPTTSQYATVNIGLANNVSSLAAALPGDYLTLGPIRDLQGGVESITASAATIEVTGIDTLAANGSSGQGNVSLAATGNLTVDPGAIVQTGTGTLSLAADVQSNGAGDDGAGTLSIGAGATVTSTNSSSSAITLRGAAVNIDTSANPAVVGGARSLGTTSTATLAGLEGPGAMVVDASGNLYVANADNGYYSVSKFAPGATAPAATLTGVSEPSALAIGPNGNLYVANEYGTTVSEFASGATTPTTTLTGLSDPSALAFDRSGNLYVANGNGTTVSEFAPGATTPATTLTGLFYPSALALDASGNLYVANFGRYPNYSTTVSKFASGATTPTATLTGLSGPWALAFDSSGNLYVANFAGGLGSTVSEFAAGATTPTATLTRLTGPSALAFDSSGNLYVANSGYDGLGATVSKFAPGATTPTATLTGLDVPDALAFDHGGNLYVANSGYQGSGSTVSKFAPGTTTAGVTLSGLSLPDALAFDSSGNLYVVNKANNTVSEFARGATMPTATLTGLTNPDALAFDSSGNLYVANGGNGLGTTLSEYAPGDTTPTATLTGLHDPAALAFDSSGNLYVSNETYGTASEFAPGATTPTATLTGLTNPDAMAFDPSGNLYIVNENGTTVSKFAPGATTPTATLTGLDNCVALVVDGGGNVYVANQMNFTVSKFAPGATTPTATLSGGLSLPAALAFDPSGNLYVLANTTVSKFAPGAITPSAVLTDSAQPECLAFDPSGNLFVGNSSNNTLSEFAPMGASIPTAAGVVIHSSLPTRPMSIGGANNAVNGINLTDAELAQICTTSSGTVTFGDSSQTGNITFTTATPATMSGAATVVIQSLAGSGGIILDDGGGTGTALNGNGAPVTLTPGTGGIATPLYASGVPLAAQGFNATGLTLTPTLNFAPAVGTQLTVVNNTATPAASHPITGTFANLPQGGTISATYNGITCWFQTNYAGGDGNDLVLTAIPSTTTTLSTSQASVTYGTPVTFTATVTAQSGSAAPVGSVDFYDATAGTDLGLGSLENSTATTSIWTLTTGAKSLNATAGDVITATYAPGVGLAGSSGTTTQVVTPVALTVTGVSAADKDYNGNTVATLNTAGAALVGVLSGDVVTLGTSGASGTFASKNVGNNIAVSGLTLGGAQAGDYLLTQPIASANITARAITVTAAANTKIYDGTTSATALPTVTPGSLAGGDTAAFSETYNSAAVGTGKTLTPAGLVNDGNGGNNYTVTLVDNTSGAINPVASTVSLTWPGPGNALSLTDSTSGGTPAIVISEPTPGVSLMKIDLGAGCLFASGSTTSATGLTYQNAGSPTTSQYATIDISSAGNVSSLAAALPGDYLTLGPIRDTAGGVSGITASAGTIEVMGISTASVNGNVNLAASGNLTVDAGASILSGTGTISLAADVNADGTGNDGLGALSIDAGAVVDSTNSTPSAITLRGASLSIDTSGNPAIVGSQQSLSTTPSATLGGGIERPCALAFDTSGNLYVANNGNGTVSRFAPGTTAPDATLTVSGASALVFDAGGNLYVTGLSTVSEFAPGATTPSALLTGLSGPDALVFDASGNLFVANYGNNTVSEFAPGATTPTATLTGLYSPDALAVDTAGNLYVANWGGYGVSKFAPGATTPTATLGSGSYAEALAFDGSGNLYVAYGSSKAVGEFAAGATTLTATLTGVLYPYALAFGPDGNLYVGSCGDDTVREFAHGATTPTATISGLDWPSALAFDAGGDLYVANENDTTVSKFAPGATTPTAILRGLAGPYALAFDASGNLYAANFFFGRGSTVSEFAPGATTPTSTLTGLNGPDALAVDGAGDLFVAYDCSTSYGVTTVS